RFLDEEERERLLQACQESANSYLYTIVVLALSTGMRKSEILNLRWNDVDFLQKRITLNETKNGDMGMVPLVGLAHQLLKKLSEQRSIVTSLLFPSKDPKKPIDIRSAWEVALKRAKISNYSFHCNRHSCASYLLAGGASLGQIQEILRHKSIALSKRYSHLCSMEAEKKIEEMNQRIFGG
ncbi:MAG: site-specific integrase, partial [Verrucomicrobia bacterium]|nr:site-specific integrase [Verrucomicrobiota bacterium]